MVAVVGGIVSGLVVFLIPKVVGGVFKFLKNTAVKLKQKIKKKIKYYKGELSAAEYMKLKKKPIDQLTTRERKIIEDTERIWGEQIKEHSEKKKKEEIENERVFNRFLKNMRGFGK
ncbi:hypothetical protein [Bacillus sp. NA_165.1]|uniref:hypothetical protein n=1 Tax=unclassified Bacillus (in: firmicutes) TaxID=185979 RepID=UPI0040466D1B